jgi:hypothetical protein
VAYGHDNINNLGHSMSDFMNVWTMAWMAGVQTNVSSLGFILFEWMFNKLCLVAQQSVFFNIDSIRGGHNFNDELGQFGL